MRNEQTLHIRQGTQLALTSRLQQAIGLLQLSTAELHQFVNDQLMENPLLSNADTLFDGNSSERDMPLSSFEKDAFGDDGNAAPPDADFEWQSPYQGGINGSILHDGYFSVTPLWKSEISFYDHVQSQIRQKFPDPTDQKIADALWHFMDEDGFLDPHWQVMFSFDDVPKNTTWSDVKRVLSVLQTLDPVGIFAESVVDSLLVQMKAKRQDNLDDQTWSMDDVHYMMEAFKALQKQPFEKVCKQFNLDIATFQLFLKQLRQLEFRPAKAFKGEEAIMGISPDLRFYQDASGDVAVALNPSAVPKVILNSVYYHDLKQRVRKAEDIAYLKERLSAANWLVQALHKRTVTLLQVASEIAQWQKDFLLFGREMRPMTLKDIAQKAGVHESTVSRVTTAKYIETSRGIFELKNLFVNIGGAQDGTASSVEIQNVLRALILDESKDRPLSDEDLVSLIEARGMSVARRTIAKYRTLLGIGSSSERKRQYRMQNLKSS